MIAHVTYTSLGLAILAFLVCLVLGWRAQKALETVADNATPANDKAGLGVPFTGLVDLVKALGTLADSFTKSGPYVAFLLTSVLYLAIAAAGAGIFKSTPEGAKAPAGAAADKSGASK
jgi:hypothetical protein